MTADATPRGTGTYSHDVPLDQPVRPARIPVLIA
ncbi:MAG: hypothetical protein JWN35_350 [Frankiales bacterium]|jgi:hypothetical protein|nr:hypothetical protein [Frankiales bacterium]